MKITIWTLFFCAFIPSFAFSQKSTTLSSPNGKIVCALRTTEQGVQYSITFNKKVLINLSWLAVQFKDVPQTGRWSSRVVVKDGVEQYQLLTGKVSSVIAHYKEATLTLQQKDSPHLKMNIIFRAFDDGIAFRYEFIGQDNAASFLLTDELDEFRLTGNPVAKVLPLPNYTSSHEGLYTTASFNNLRANMLFDMPALFQFPGEVFMAITEAALLDYSGMYLMKENNVLRSKLSPLPSQSSAMVKGTFPHKSPWRVLIISDKIGDLLSSTMLTSLCPPSRISDVSWIKPGKTTFPWWNGNVTPDTLNAPGNNFITQKYYIDFCKRSGIEYHSVVEYGLHQWYTDDGVGFSPGPHSDVTTPVPGLDMKEVCDYAHAQNVGVRVWVHWAALYPRIDAAFEAFEKWGISGMMIDFMDRDDQEMVNIQTEMLEKAAKHHLHIQFHGAYKPTGLSRTYPNEFTREGTLNYEVQKWSKGLSAEHDLDIVFTRSIAGSTDYHLGGFRAVPDSLYQTQYTRPLLHGTRCHMLAMYVVLENPLAMVCDYPAAYEGQDGFDFLQKVPTTWDETKVLAAKVDEYIVVARRKGNDWYIGSINNRTGRELSLPLDFLSKGEYTSSLYGDSDDARKYPNKVVKSERVVTSTDTLLLRLASNGGAVVWFRAK